MLACFLSATMIHRVSYVGIIIESRREKISHPFDCDHMRQNSACLARYRDKLNISFLHEASLAIMLSRKLITKARTRLRRCAGWSVPLLFACNKIRVSWDEA